VESTHDLRPAASGGLVKRYTDWGRGEHRREWTVLKALSASACGLVPELLGADLDAEPPWVEISRLAGTPLSGSLTAQQLAALESALRRLWSVPAGDLPLRRFHPAQARSVVGSGLAVADRPAGMVGEAYDLCRSFLDGPVPEPWPGSEPVVSNGDSNLRNFLWDGSAVRIVDFEDGGASEVAYEVGFLVEHLSGHDTDWTPLLESFRDDVDPGRLRDARLTSAAHWLLLLLPGRPAHRRNPPGTLDAQARRILTQLA
jgi:hypothetical protein